MNRKAFTLIELLVVIAIIAILAAILFPVFAQAKQAAKKSVDLSSVKQTNLAMLLYAGDADDVAPNQIFDNEINAAWGRVPAWVIGAGAPLGFMDPTALPNWGREIQPYMKSIGLMVSPVAPKVSGNVPWSYVNDSRAGNSSWFMSGVIVRQPLTMFSSPAELVAFQSAETTTRESRVLPLLINNNFVYGIDTDHAGNTFPDAGANYGWADGHAGFKRRGQLTYRNMGVTGTVRIDGATGFPNTTGLKVPRKQPENWDNGGDFGG